MSLILVNTSEEDSEIHLLADETEILVFLGILETALNIGVEVEIFRSHFWGRKWRKVRSVLYRF